jgi:DNA-binding NarL/FixJ family response regulator
MWKRAEADSVEAMKVARDSRNAHGLQLSFSVHLRVLAQRGRHQAALALQVPVLTTSLPAARAEVLCSRALVLASVGRVDEALELAVEARGLSRAVEPAVLLAAVEAVSALKCRDDRATDRVADLEETAFSTGAIDLLVTAYRSTPELLAVLLRVSPARDRLVALLRRVGDEDLAGAVGEPVAIDDDPRARLSRRERDVYDLIREGLTNRQIARLLFIEESTVKAHAHHIYDKLGTRSRTALTFQAMLERADQATSAIETAESEDGSYVLCANSRKSRRCAKR